MRLELVDLALVVDSARPRLERNLVQYVGRQCGDGASAPAAGLLAGDRTDRRLTIGSTRSWRRWTRRALAASTSSTAAGLGLAASALLSLRSSILAVTSGHREHCEDDRKC